MGGVKNTYYLCCVLEVGRKFRNQQSAMQMNGCRHIFKVVTEDTVIEALVPTTVSLLC